MVEQDAQAQEARLRLCGNGGSARCSRRHPPALITHIFPLRHTIQAAHAQTHTDVCTSKNDTHTRTLSHTPTPDRYRARFVPDKCRPLCLTRSSTSLSLHQRAIEEGWEKRQRASLPRSLASKPNKEPQIAKPLGCLSACR